QYLSAPSRTFGGSGDGHFFRGSFPLVGGFCDSAEPAAVLSSLLDFLSFKTRLAAPAALSDVFLSFAMSKPSLTKHPRPAHNFRARIHVRGNPEDVWYVVVLTSQAILTHEEIPRNGTCLKRPINQRHPFVAIPRLYDSWRSSAANFHRTPPNPLNA